MLIHHDDERRRDCPATPTGPEGCGGTAPSSLSLLESGAVALATIATLFLTRDTSVLSLKFVT